MRPDVAEVIDRLRHSRSVPLLRLIDDADLEGTTPFEPDSAVVEPYRWLLRRVGAGLRLTKAGYLPPSVVSEAMQALGWGAGWIGKHNREDLTIPVLDLRESARRMGLLRVQRGVLLRTVAGRKASEDADELWWHIAAHLPESRNEPQRHAGVIYLLTVAAGRPRSDELLAEGLTVLGWGDANTPNRSIQWPHSPRCWTPGRCSDVSACCRSTGGANLSRRRPRARSGWPARR